ncbi:MAG: DUF4139 domain-containing protein [Sedimentisphaerales bacterium]|nr:DUF4139 domain-containing protein [Sedimentisphaerales bacterium]
MENKSFSLILIMFIVCAAVSMAKEPADNTDTGMGVTVYNANFAVIKEQRQMDFKKGLNTISFTDVASSIEPPSVSFKCLSTPGSVTILEQNYEYDLVNTQSLLKRYLDKDVYVSIKGSGADEGTQIVGQLMAARGSDLILKTSNQTKIISNDSIENISLAQIGEDLVTKPTLVWLVRSESAGSQQCHVTYTTGNIGWNADYTAILSADETALDISGWVTINNQSGATYKDAKIKLIAGDVRKVEERKARKMIDYAMVAGAGDAAFEEKAFMEYHLYTLSRPSTINNNQTKQIEFITPALNVPAEKLYIYERSQKPDKVQVKFEFDNKEQNGLGIALPKGKVRVFKRDTDDMLEFVGEDLIDHTPKNEKISLYIGDAFDIAVEYKMLENTPSRRSRYQKHSIELRNRKDEPVTVFVDEKFSLWGRWKIEQSSHPYTKKDASTARFKVKIMPDKTETIEYSVTERW